MHHLGNDDRPLLTPERLNQVIQHASFYRGKDAFNRQEYFDAHEHWEDLWRALAAGEPSRELLQGLIQVAVCGVHFQRENTYGAITLLNKGIARLQWFDECLTQHQMALPGFQSFLAQLLLLNHYEGNPDVSVCKTPTLTTLQNIKINF